MEEAFLDGRDATEGSNPIQVRGHESEGLFLAVFAEAESGDGGLIAGVAEEVESAESLDGDNAPLTQGA
jgi:hypothetical protein